MPVSYASSYFQHPPSVAADSGTDPKMSFFTVARCTQYRLSSSCELAQAENEHTYSLVFSFLQHLCSYQWVLEHQHPNTSSPNGAMLEMANHMQSPFEAKFPEVPGSALGHVGQIVGRHVHTCHHPASHHCHRYSYVQHSEPW